MYKGKVALAELIVIDVGPWAVVGTMTGLILLAPATIVASYLLQQRRRPELPASDPASEETNS